MHEAGLHIGIYDITSELEIPAYQCVLFDSPDAERAMGYFWGFGCHVAPGIALSRAITEAVQCRLTEITGTRDDIEFEAYASNRDRDELREMLALLNDPPPTRRFGDRVSRRGQDLREDLEMVLSTLRQAGITRAVAVDLSQPAFGIPVVKVIVPELEGYPHEHVPGTRVQSRLRALEAEASHG